MARSSFARRFHSCRSGSTSRWSIRGSAPPAARSRFAPAVAMSSWGRTTGFSFRPRRHWAALRRRASSPRDPPGSPRSRAPSTAATSSARSPRISRTGTSGSRTSARSSPPMASSGCRRPSQQRSPGGSTRPSPTSTASATCGSRAGDGISPRPLATLMSRPASRSRSVARAAADAVVAPSFGHVPEGAVLLYLDSSGDLALAEHGGNLAARIGSTVGDAVEITRRD